MPKSLEVITHDVLELPHAQRLVLAQLILDLEGGPADANAEAAWEEEIGARIKACDEGRMGTVDCEIFRAEIEQRFGR